MNLGKKYKQLFEGKVRSNDAKLLKEFQYEMDWEDVIDLDALDFETLFAAEDGTEVQIPTSQGEVGGGYRKDTEVAGEGLPEFLVAKIDKSEPDYITFEFDKDSAAALDASGVYGGAEQVAAELEGWSEGELENYKPTSSGSSEADEKFKKQLAIIAHGAKAGKDMVDEINRINIFAFPAIRKGNKVASSKEMEELKDSGFDGVPKDQYNATIAVMKKFSEEQPTSIMYRFEEGTK
jgi:hypothetical protein